MAARITDIREHPFDWIRVKVAAAHLDDRAEAAVERAAARGFDDIHPAAEQRIAAEHARIAIRQPQALGGERNDWRCRVVNETLCRPVRQSGNAGQTSRFDIGLPRFAIGLDRTQERTERALAFTAHEEV